MLKTVKWVAVIILMPLLVAQEIFSVLKDQGVELPDPDQVLSELKDKK